MSIVIPQNLNVKVKAKAKTSQKGAPKEDDQEFDEKIESAKTAISAKELKEKLKTTDEKSDVKKIKLDSKDAQEVKLKEPKEQEMQHGISNTAVARQVVAHSQAKQELGAQKAIKDFKEDAWKEKNLTTLLEQASKDKRLGLTSADVVVETDGKKAKLKDAKDIKELNVTTPKATKLADEAQLKPTKEKADTKEDAKIQNAKDKALKSNDDIKSNEKQIGTKAQTLKEQDGAKALKIPQDESVVSQKGINEKPTLSDLLKLSEPKETKEAKELKDSKKGKKQADGSTKDEIKDDYKKTNTKIHSEEKSDTVQKPSIHYVDKEPQSKQETSKESKQSLQMQNPEQLQTVFVTTKTEELNVKIAQTTQVMKYFSEDLKEQIDNYRPPLVKLSLNLNPADLGAVNVTMVARGGALNVSMTSSQTTLQMIMQNSGQLQQNLTALGFTNLAINFNSSDKKAGDKKSDSGSEKRDEVQKRYKETVVTKESFIDSIDLKIFDSKYI